jgi:hypothetical protein
VSASKEDKLAGEIRECQEKEQLEAQNVLFQTHPGSTRAIGEETITGYTWEFQTRLDSSRTVAATYPSEQPTVDGPFSYKARKLKNSLAVRRKENGNLSI